jgi:Tfp pilus assembly protein PilN
MRELEFLPAWYPKARQRRRLIILQVWMTLLIAIGLGFWSFLVRTNVTNASDALDELSARLAQTDTELKRLDELLRLQKQLGVQDQIIARLGTHITPTRLLAAIENVLPSEMALINMSVTTEEQVRQQSNLAAARAEQQKQETVDRRLKISLQGVAPTDVDLANFLARLASERFFEQVALSYARERTERGHVMREFEVTFVVNLTPR